jgi:hypothetical protein
LLHGEIPIIHSFINGKALSSVVKLTKYRIRKAETRPISTSKLNPS